MTTSNTEKLDPAVRHSYTGGQGVIACVEKAITALAAEWQEHAGVQAAVNAGDIDGRATATQMNHLVPQLAALVREWVPYEVANPVTEPEGLL